ncbi:MarR family winged helix-turn-helix transcriptional regulator [Roseibium sp. RKSG952]|uniref:MarR family winged helix-turn-helix transcriptional regulator n=1 Tax=Roseibium sp. RKSG952 TaxID=2529384 RepID=UPI0012BC0855|nr:MarR family transcriptional regulator [Roseibium sp. RKSG952]MTH95750.1 MarR family transcriptional regulator [Roseibium sp. RKSG952]
MAAGLRVFHLLQVAHSALFRAADHRARQEMGLTITQIAVLIILNDRDGQPASEIATRLSMGKSSLTALIDRLCEKDLVRRRPSANDGRVTLVHLEDAGRRAAEAARIHTRHYNAALLEPFTEEEQNVIGRFLQHLAHNANAIINVPDNPSRGEGSSDDDN